MCRCGEVFVCPIDGKRYAHRHSLTNHMRTHTDERPYVCKQCNKGFQRADVLKSHIKSKHGVEQYPCSDCNERFRSESCLITHKRRLHGVADSSHTCKQCGFKARYKNQLLNHQPYEGAPRMTYKCSQCCASYSYNVSLRDHVLSSHTGLFKCPGCRVNLGRISRFFLHIRKCNVARSKGVDVKRHIQRVKEKVTDYVKRQVEARKTRKSRNRPTQHNNDGPASGTRCKARNDSCFVISHVPNPLAPELPAPPPRCTPQTVPEVNPRRLNPIKTTEKSPRSHNTMNLKSSQVSATDVPTTAARVNIQSGASRGESRKASEAESVRVTSAKTQDGNLSSKTTPGRSTGEQRHTASDVAGSSIASLEDDTDESGVGGTQEDNQESLAAPVEPTPRNPIHRETTRQKVTEEEHNQLRKSILATMFQDPSAVKVTIKTASGILTAHRDYFKAACPAMFANLTADQVVDLSEFQEDVVKAMLEYICYGHSDLLLEAKKVPHFLKLAHKLNLELLKKDCEASIEEGFQLTVETALDMLLIVHDSHLKNLETRVKQFIVEHKDAFKETETFKNLVTSSSSEDIQKMRVLLQLLL